MGDFSVSVKHLRATQREGWDLFAQSLSAFILNLSSCSTQAFSLFLTDLYSSHPPSDDFSKTYFPYNFLTISASAAWDQNCVRGDTIKSSVKEKTEVI